MTAWVDAFLSWRHDFPRRVELADIRVAAQVGAEDFEQIVIADVDLADLAESRINGTTIPLLDKRREVYERAVVEVDARSAAWKA